MSRNYIAAASAGMFIGCLVLVSWGLFGFHTGDWRIPNLDQLHFADKAVLQVRMLERQAIWLRICALFCESGFTFIAVPAFLGCALLRLTDAGKTYTLIRCIANTVWFVLVLLTIVWFSGFIIGLFAFASLHDVVQILYNGLGCGAFVVELMGLLLAPHLAIFYFLVQLALNWELALNEYKSRQKNAPV